MAPRCQHTCSAVLLRVDDGDAFVFVVAAARLFGVDVDAGVGDADRTPHDSSPSSDEPEKNRNVIVLGFRCVSVEIRALI